MSLSHDWCVEGAATVQNEPLAATFGNLGLDCLSQRSSESNYRKRVWQPFDVETACMSKNINTFCFYLVGLLTIYYL